MLKNALKFVDVTQMVNQIHSMKDVYMDSCRATFTDEMSYGHGCTVQTVGTAAVSNVWIGCTIQPQMWLVWFKMNIWLLILELIPLM